MTGAAQKPVDFATGALPAAFWLRSAAFFIDADPETGAMIPSAARISRWLERFDDWYKLTIGCERTDRLHLLYHRDVTLVGARFLTHVPQIIEIAETAARCGVGFSLTVPLDEAMADEDAMMRIVGAKAVSTLAISVEGDDEAPDREQLARILQGVVAAKQHIAFLGPYDAISRLGLLDVDGVSSAQITVHPKDGAGPPAISQTPVNACFSRLRIYADVTGELYPCLGLVGVPGARLGAIDDAIEDTVFGGAPYALDIDALARRGPALTGKAPEKRFTGLPWACERHRRQWLAEAPAPDAPLQAGARP